MENNINTFEELYTTCKKQNRKIYEVAIDYEVSLGEYSEYQIRLQAAKSLEAMKKAIKEGLKSTQLSPSKMSGDDCDKLQKRFKNSESLLGKTSKK